MLGDFTYENPTRLHFGENSLDKLKVELALFGKTVMLSYGGGSIKRTGLYDKILTILNEAGKTIVEDSGVMPNPTVEKLYEGCKIARENNVDLILAVGGGSVCDYAKGVAASAWLDGDPWQTYYLGGKNPESGQRILPVGCVLTMVGTGSEMNGGSVITNHTQNLKLGKVFDSRLMPKFTILNPKLTFTVPQYQMVAGIFDIMSHLLEQYCSNEHDNTSDYLNEGLMRSLIHSSRIAVKHPQDYEARSNIMWTATWALNTLLKQGKRQDWMVHMIGHAIGVVTNATHGMTLASVSIPYYKYIMHSGLHKFVRFAKNVWDVRPEGKTDEEVALEGIAAMEAWMREIGVTMKASELGVTLDNIEEIADATVLGGGFMQLTRDDVVEILKRSL
ncbi:MAG: iron-containing alcohol dehydrogenase [Bacteroidales bacterium]|nr:iron-containing alcohol dehydrogenase [Bacteroidales bacterium]